MPTEKISAAVKPEALWETDPANTQSIFGLRGRRQRVQSLGTAMRLIIKTFK